MNRFLSKAFEEHSFQFMCVLEDPQNEAQGHSCSVALGLDFHKHVFSHGQIYVALSRATHPKSFYIVCPTFLLTQNVVYLEFL